MTKRRFLEVALGLGTFLQLSAGCTSGNAAPPSVGPTGGAGGAGGDTSASAPDASTADQTGGTGGTMQAMSDASMPDAKPQCASAGSTNACTSCCSQNHQEGTNVFFRALTQCACQTSVCGPAAPPPPDTGDGGTAEGGTTGDGGGGMTAMMAMAAPAQGGPCTTECTSANASVSSGCSDCIRSSIGMSGTAGPCEMGISSICAQDADCSALFSCLSTCP